MFTVHVIFLCLLNGYGTEIIPFGEATAKTKFPTEQECRNAGEAIAANAGPTLAAGLKESGAGVLYGAQVECHKDGDAI